jgi:hypothetical protein
VKALQSLIRNALVLVFFFCSYCYKTSCINFNPNSSKNSLCSSYDHEQKKKTKTKALRIRD